MPNISNTAAGGAVLASAQVLNRTHTVITTVTFGEDGGQFATTPVQGLPEVYINIFQFPEYNDGTTLHPSRNYLAWRPVFLMSANITVPSVAGLTFDEWLPAAAPQLLVTSTPNIYRLTTGGVAAIAVEFDTSGGVAVGNQGEDRVIISISASQG